MKKIFFVIVAMLFLLVGCSKENSLNQILKDDRIDRLIHQEEVDNGVVLFYVKKFKGYESVNFSLETEFVKKTLFGWKKTMDRAGFTDSSQLEIFGQYANKFDEESPFPMIFGRITNPRIEQIKVEFGDKPKEIRVKTIRGKEDYIWFAFVEEPKEKTIYTIKGYSKNGEVVETFEIESVHLPKKK